MQAEDSNNDNQSSAQQARKYRLAWLAIIITIGVASLSIRLLMRYDFDNSALLYVGIPFLISLAIVVFRPLSRREKWWHAYRDRAYIALIIFLSSSIVLFEGFVCVLMFMPIYFFVVSIGFLISWYTHTRSARSGKMYVSILPLLILASSIEGTTEFLSFDRESHVTVTKTASLSRDQILRNLAQPIDLQKDRGWLMSVFPMPYRIEAESLNPGDIHRVYTRYHHWFITNTHEGEMHLQIVDVQPNRIKTRFVHDSTYFASYLTAIGTEISLVATGPGETEISLRIDYERKLDPAWYFHPLEQIGVSQMASLLIDEVMIRE